LKNFLVLGGDLRQLYLAEKLKENGENIEVYFYANKKTANLKSHRF